MGSSDTGSTNSGSPASNLGNHQWLSLPSGSLYAHIGGLQYHAGVPVGAGEDKYRINAYAGESSCIRIFQPHDSDNADAILFLPKPTSASFEATQSGLLERLGIIEQDLEMTVDDLDARNKLSDKCAVYRNGVDVVTGASPFVDRGLHEFIRQYSSSLEGRYAQEGEKFGRAVGSEIGAWLGLGNAIIIGTGMCEPSLENFIIAVVSTVTGGLLSSQLCKYAWGNSAKNDAHETLRKRLLAGHKDETHLHHLAKFIRDDYRQIDVTQLRERVLDDAFASLARTPAGEGLTIQWKGLPYHKIVERCEMLLGVKPAQYVGRESVSVPAPQVVHEPVHAVEPEVKIVSTTAATKCPHCHDELKEGDSCITGLLSGAHAQAHQDCSKEMAGDKGVWRPISGAYAYESLVDHATDSPEKKKDERRVKE